VKADALRAIEEWYRALPVWRGGMPARGVLAVALIVLDRLKERYDLDIDSHRTVGRGQIRAASQSAVARILQRHGETRPFLAEGGRTNRGSMGAVESLLDSLRSLPLASLTAVERAEVLDALEGYLVDRVRDYHRRQRLKLTYDPGLTAWQITRDLLDAAKKSGKEGPVAQYLVGAKLELTFPDTPIRNESYSVADDPQERPGDFLIEDTAFHVTVAPMPGVYERCLRNIAEGYRTYLLVPDHSLAGARQNAEGYAPGKIMVDSIEAFIGRNVEELSRFSKDRLAEGLRRLFDAYNRRVDDVELDKSMLIELPRNLTRGL